MEKNYSGRPAENFRLDLNNQTERLQLKKAAREEKKGVLTSKKEIGLKTELLLEPVNMDQFICKYINILLCIIYHTKFNEQANRKKVVNCTKNLKKLH